MSRVEGIFLILSKAWNFYANGKAIETETATAKPNPSITAIASIDSYKDTNNHSSTVCIQCNIDWLGGYSASETHITVGDRIVIPYITKQKNGSNVTSFSTQILNISRLDNHSYITQAPTMWVFQIERHTHYWIDPLQYIFRNAQLCCRGMLIRDVFWWLHHYGLQLHPATSI